MFDIVKRFFGATTAGNHTDTDQNTAHDVRVAACALFMEMGRIDETFTESETATVLSILKEKYNLTKEHAEALMIRADRELEESVDLWQFARLINENYSVKEKLDIIEILWQIVFVDEKMDQYENYLMHKLSKLLRLSHNQLIEAKQKVIHSR
jgi:uncharacterized tellurite resistance protein B-like protein